MKTTQIRISLPKAACMGTLLLAGILATSPVSAQWLTYDSAAVTKAIDEYAEQAKRWTETAAQYEKEIGQFQKEVAHYQQMIASVANLKFPTLAISNNLTPITDTSTFVSQACPGSGGAVSSVLHALGLSSLDLNGNIAQSQQQICQQVTLLQIDKFNKTADLLTRMGKYGSLFQDIDRLRDALGGTTAIGDLQANTNEAVRDSNKLAKEVNDWRGLMAADDAAIRTLQDQQSILANIALKGKSSVIGNIVQAGAFAAAFSN
jgi:hypothetical protein